MTDLYRDLLLDHSRRPRNYGVLPDAAILHHEANPSCGDVIDLYLTLDEHQVIERISFTGQGCVISQASTSLLLETVMGRSKSEILAMSPRDVVGLLGVEPGPMRMNCALLPLRALQEALTARES